MIIPVLRHDALLRDIECADPGDGVCLWWLGQSGFLLKSASGLAVVDPYLSDSLTRKYAQTDKPHQRMTEIPLLPTEVPTVDFVSSSHNHTDHLDAETLTPILDQRSTPTLVYPAANRAFVDTRLGGSPPRAIGLRDGEKAAIGGWTVHGVVAAHDTIDRDEHGAPHCMGYVIQTGEVCVYHSGDTRWAPEILEQLVDFEIDAAILPINGALPTRRVAGNLWGQEAAAFARAMGARLAIPCHYEMFSFNTETPDAFVAKCAEIGQPHRVARCGERITVAP